MRYVSLFSGIEAASVAWADLPLEPVCFSEIDPFASAVLAYRFPDVPNVGDITNVKWEEVIDRYGTVDLVVGGSPCQSFSVAGARESLDGESRLMYEYIRACDEIRPNWVLWENVPGVLNTHDDAFGQLLDSLQDIGYVDIAWRVFDAQFFGVAQRRRRVFLVGCLRAVGASAAVLFESDSVRGNTQSSKQKREELTRAAEKRAGIGSFKYHQGAGAGNIGYQEELSPTLTLDHNPAVLTPWDVQSKRVASHEQPVVCMADNNANAAVDEELCGTLKVVGGAPVMACVSNGDEIVGPLCARDYKGVGNEYVNEGKVVCQRRM